MLSTQESHIQCFPSCFISAHYMTKPEPHISSLVCDTHLFGWEPKSSWSPFLGFLHRIGILGSVSLLVQPLKNHTFLHQVRHRPKAHYMRKQPDITEGMRAILVDWLVEVGEEYKLRTETLYLAVNFLDRFLSCMSVLRGKLQLVGTAAILLAS